MESLSTEGSSLTKTSNSPTPVQESFPWLMQDQALMDLNVSTGGKVVYMAGREFNLPLTNSAPLLCRLLVFLCTAETSWLNGKHVVFGSVVDGMDVVRAVEGVRSNSGSTRAPVRIENCGQL